MRGKAHSEEVKAQVMAALLAGQGISETAREYRLSVGTVNEWKRSLSMEQIAEVRNKKREEFSELVADYLRETLITLAVQVRHFRDADWLKKQSADHLAVLHGIACDKAIRLLEAAERAAEYAASASEPEL